MDGHVVKAEKILSRAKGMVWKAYRLFRTAGGSSASGIGWDKIDVDALDEEDAGGGVLKVLLSEVSGKSFVVLKEVGESFCFK